MFGCIYYECRVIPEPQAAEFGSRVDHPKRNELSQGFAIRLFLLHARAGFHCLKLQ